MILVSFFHISTGFQLRKNAFKSSVHILRPPWTKPLKLTKNLIFTLSYIIKSDPKRPLLTLLHTFPGTVWPASAPNLHLSSATRRTIELQSVMRTKNIFAINVAKAK